MNNYELICVGNAIVDVIANVDDDFLLNFNLIKGSMKIVDEDEFIEIFNQLKTFKTISGGSAANTAVGFSSCGGDVLFIGNVSNDEFGKKFKKSISQANVFFKSKLKNYKKDQTSKSIILVTKDAERTMCTYIGASAMLSHSDTKKIIFEGSKILYLEGYLFDKKDTKNSIIEMSKEAKSKGLLVSLSLSDKFCVDRHREDFLNLIKNQIDFVFANEEELKSLYQMNFENSLKLLREIVENGVITLGKKGSLVFSQKEKFTINSISKKVIDTTGAGDLYAAGFLFGLSKNMSFEECGKLGSICASEIISHLGARPKVELKSLF